MHVSWGWVNAARIGRSMLLSVLFVTVLAMQGSTASAQNSPRRIALVIGNAEYTVAGGLENVTRDVDAVYQRLTALQFHVTLVHDAGQATMRSEISRFMGDVQPGDMVVIYYAGHGLEQDGESYMLPVDLEASGAANLRVSAVRLSDLYTGLPDHLYGMLILFDACRETTPFQGGRSSRVGSHSIQHLPDQVQVLMSTSQGDPAMNGPVDSYSPFASAVLTALRQPGIGIDAFTREVKNRVRDATAGRQIPSLAGQLPSPFVFDNTAAAPAAYAAVASPSSAETQAAAEPTPTVPTAPPPVDMAMNTAPSGQVTRAYAAPGAQETASPAASQPAASLAVAASAAPVAAPPMAVPPPAASPLAAAPTPSQPVAAATPQYQPLTSYLRAPATAATVYTIAALGRLTIPSPPELAPVPDISLPARYCSAEERNSFLTDTILPVYRVALANVDLSNNYLAGLNTLSADYRSQPGGQEGFMTQVLAQFRAYTPVNQEILQQSLSVRAKESAARDVPVEPC